MRGWRQRDLRIADGKGFEHIVYGLDIDLPLPNGGDFKNTAGNTPIGGNADLLHDIGVGGGTAGAEPAHIVAVHQVEIALFVSRENKMRMRGGAHGVWQYHRAGGAQIEVACICRGKVEKCEEICQRQATGGAEFQQALAEIVVGRNRGDGGCGVKAPVPDCEIDIAAGIRCQPCTALPYSAVRAIRRGIEDPFALKCAGIKAKNPTVIRRDISVRSPADIDCAVEEQKRRTLILAQGGECHVAARGSVALSWDGSRDGDWTKKFLGSVNQAQSV